jgi:hypothetical protein
LNKKKSESLKFIQTHFLGENRRRPSKTGILSIADCTMQGERGRGE